MHRKCEDFAKAAELAEFVAPQELPVIHRRWGDAKLKEGSVRNDLDH